MRRTLMERIRHEVAPVARSLRRDPIFSEMELMSCGSLRVNIANPRFAHGYEALAVKTELGRQYGSVSATFRGSDADRVREILREADRLTIKAVSQGVLEGAPLDHGRFGASLFTGEVVVRIPSGDTGVLAALGKSRNDVRNGVVLVCAKERTILPKIVDEANLRDLSCKAIEIKPHEMPCPA